MPADLPKILPSAVYAGDSLQFQREFSDYPASDGWSLSYSLVGSSGHQAFTATADGDSFVVDVDASTTSGWTAGQYRLVESVSKAGARYTLASRVFQVLANLAGATGAVDTRTHARKVLDAIEAWIESKAPTAASFELAGRKLQNYPLPDLLKLRDRYRAEVAREERIAAGLGATRILTRL